MATLSDVRVERFKVTREALIGVDAEDQDIARLALEARRRGYEWVCSAEVGEDLEAVVEHHLNRLGEPSDLYKDRNGALVACGLQFVD